LGDYVAIEVLVNGERLVLSQVKRLFKVQLTDSPAEMSVKEREERGG
jgi:hypothetical protein